MGLFMKMEEMWDLPIDGESAEEGRHIPHWFGNLAYVVVGAITKVAFRYRVDGRENLRAFKGKCGAVIVANHTSYLDVVFLYETVRPSQWCRFIARDTLFEAGGGILGQMLSRAGAFPVTRDTADLTSVRRAVKFLKDKELVGIMPEGTRRNKSARIPSIHNGAAFIARMAKAPILPCTVRDAERVKQKGERLRFPKITIEYGTPIFLDDFDWMPKDDRLDACSWYAMRECFAMNLRVPAEEVDMVALFPESKDYSAEFAAHPIPKHTSEEAIARYAPKPRSGKAPGKVDGKGAKSHASGESVPSDKVASYDESPAANVEES